MPWIYRLKTAPFGAVFLWGNAGYGGFRLQKSACGLGAADSDPPKMDGRQKIRKSAKLFAGRNGLVPCKGNG